MREKCGLEAVHIRNAHGLMGLLGSLLSLLLSFLVIIAVSISNEERKVYLYNWLSVVIGSYCYISCGKI